MIENISKCEECGKENVRIFFNQNNFWYCFECLDDELAEYSKEEIWEDL